MTRHADRSDRSDRSDRTDRTGRHGRPRGPIARTASIAFLATALACASVGGGPSGDEYQAFVKHNDAAREQLRFGMTAAEASAVMGTAQIVPPWANPRKIGPQVVPNPLDTLEIEAANGDRYEIHRYASGLYGDWRCPFVRGEAELVPLIYLDGKLVGWRWSYLESALQRRLEPDELGFRFGEFCGAEARS